MQLKTKVKLVISDGDDKIFNEYIYVKKLKKRDEREIQMLVLKAQDAAEIDQLEALSIVDEAAKLRFDKTISADAESLEKLVEIADDYGYSTILTEIDGLLEKK